MLYEVIRVGADAQPDGTIGRRRFWRGSFLFTPDTTDVGAGFKRFRPLVYDRQTFAIRNRIVAGITLGTVVVEANLTSGALITANFATEYGRQVFAVPGRIDSPRSKGCHELIKKGAKLCESAEDILSEFEYLFPA